MLSFGEPQNCAGRGSPVLLASATMHCKHSKRYSQNDAANRLAAVCIEPIVQGAAGMIVHPPGFLSRRSRALHKI